MAWYEVQKEEAKTSPKLVLCISTSFSFSCFENNFQKVFRKSTPNFPCMGKVLDSLAESGEEEERKHFCEMKSFSFEANNFSFSFFFLLLEGVQVAANLSHDFAA